MSASRPTRTEVTAALTAPGERHELQTIAVGGVPCRVFVHAPESLRAMYADAVSDRDFIVYGDERMTFAQTWAEAGRIGAVLVSEFGVVPGDRVAIAMRNYPEWMTTFAAVTSIGAIAVAMNALWGPEEMEFGLRDCGATVLVPTRSGSIGCDRSRRSWDSGRSSCGRRAHRMCRRWLR